METEKMEPTQKRGIVFVFNEDGIQQEVMGTTNADLLTAAAILVVQVERYTPNKTLDEVVKDFTEDFVKKADEHIDQLADEEPEEAGDQSGDETRL